MNKEKNCSWEKTKIVLEILAIIGASFFAVFTWGVDAWRLSSPNWAISFGKVSELTAVVENDRTRICSDASCKQAKVCIVQSKVITKNKSSVPLSVGNTDIYFYSYDKKKSGAFIDQSLYRSFQSLCNGQKNSECPTLIEKITIGPIDSQPLYPEQEAWRPFTIELQPGLLPQSLELKEFAIKKGVLVVAHQHLVTKSLWGSETRHISNAAYDLQNLCLKGNYKEESKQQDKDQECLTIKCIRPHTAAAD